jgi:hypothetical protein
VKINRSLSDRRENCHDALKRAEFKGGDPTWALWPAHDYTLRSDQQTAVANAHNALTRYVRALRHHTDQHSPLWSDDPVGQHEFPDGATLAVTLENIGGWRHVKYTDDQHSRIQDVHLPRTYTRELLRKADRIAKQNGLIDTEPPVADE